MKIYVKFLLIASLLASFPSYAQVSGGVKQKGAVVASDCVSWVGNNLIQDAGAACGAGGGGVTSFSGDTVILSNSASTGAVTATLANAAATSVLGNTTGSPAAPSYTAAPVLGTSLTDPLVIGGTGAASTLTLESTSGTGTTDAIIFKNASQAESARFTTAGRLGIGTTTPAVSLDLSQKTDALSLPVGTTGQRPSCGQAGAIRWNSTTSQFEGCNGSSWITITSTSVVPTQQRFTSGTSQTYTTPAGVGSIRVTECGAGGGSGGSGVAAGNGGTGGTTTFNSINAIGGSAGTGTSATTGGTGGSGGNGGTGSAAIRFPGGDGVDGSNVVGAIAQAQGGTGGQPYLYGSWSNAASSYGSGAIGATSASATFGGGGGAGGGECASIIIANPSATYTYSVGAGGTAGATGGKAGNGGIIVVDEYYGSSATATGQAMILISTQTASSSATLQWIGLGSSYNTYFLDCGNIVPATNNVYFEAQVGEGGTPTWETANYQWQNVSSNSTSAAPTGTNAASASKSDSMVMTSGANLINNAGFGFTGKIWISNVPSTTVYKTFTMTNFYFFGAGPNTASQYGGGAYEGDQNAVTGIRVLMSSGNIASGQCSLYGLTP